VPRNRKGRKPGFSGNFLPAKPTNCGQRGKPIAKGGKQLIYGENAAERDCFAAIAKYGKSLM
jgi:hypothetical protein